MGARTIRACGRGISCSWERTVPCFKAWAAPYTISSKPPSAKNSTSASVEHVMPRQLPPVCIAPSSSVLWVLTCGRRVQPSREARASMRSELARATGSLTTYAGVRSSWIVAGGARAVAAGAAAGAAGAAGAAPPQPACVAICRIRFIWRRDLLVQPHALSVEAREPARSARCQAVRDRWTR